VVEQPAHTRYVPGSNPGTATTHGSALPAAERAVEVGRVRRAVARAADGEQVLRRGETVVVAVSGGADSSALLDALARLGPPRGWRLHAAHVDHGLRPGSAAEAGVVARLAAERGVPFTALTVDVGSRGSLQDRARRARLRALGDLADALGATAIALGHTADDQVETVLMRLLGAGTLRSVTGMWPRRGRLARPLLGVTRRATAAYCAALSIAPVSDPANADPRFLRTRVRDELLPALEAVFPGARRSVLALAAEARALAGDAEPVAEAEARRPSAE
jgi:tRNA(Ile)-lysidine synthase